MQVPGLHQGYLKIISKYTSLPHHISVLRQECLEGFITFKIQSILVLECFWLASWKGINKYLVLGQGKNCPFLKLNMKYTNVLCET